MKAWNRSNCKNRFMRGISATILRTMPNPHQGLNPFELLEERWKTISQRDFIANPETGGREKEL